MDARASIDVSSPKKEPRPTLFRKSERQREKESFFDGNVPKDRFAHWVVANWPVKHLGKIDMTAVGILSEMRTEFGLTEQNLPPATAPAAERRRIQQKIVEIMQPGSPIHRLEEQATRQFIRDTLALPDASFQKKIAPALGEVARRRFRLARAPTDLVKLRSFLLGQKENPLTFFHDFFVRENTTPALEFGVRIARQERERKREEKKHHEQKLHFARFISSDFSQNLSIPQNLIEPRPPQNGKTSWQSGIEEFYDPAGKPKDSFTYWIVGGWESAFGKGSFDPVAVAFLSTMRNELGLTDEALPARENSDANRRKIAELFKRIKPVVETAEKIFDPATLNLLKRDSNRPAFEAGKALANQVMERFRLRYLEKPSQFEQRQGEKMNAFKQFMDGKYPYQRSELDERVYRAVYQITHRNADKKKEDDFVKHADLLSQKLYRRRFSLNRAVQKILTSPESESIFKTGAKPGLKNTLIGLGVGLIAGRLPGMIAHITETPLEQITQVEAAGAGFLLGKSRLLKDIRWRQVGKAALRGVSSAALIAGIDAVARPALQQLGVPIDVGIWWHLPVSLTIGKLLVGNVFGSLGLNVTSEWAVNAMLNKKGVVDSFTRYLWERRKNPQKASTLSQKLGPIARFVEGKQLNSLDLREAANTIKEVEESLIVLMITNPHRYRSRIIFSDEGIRQEIDNQSMLEEIQSIQNDLYHHALLHIVGRQQKEIFDILEGKVRRGKKLPALDQRLRRQVRLNTLGRWIVTPAANTAFVVGYHLPWVKEQLNHVGDFLFGETNSPPPQLPVSIQPFDESRSALFVVNESTPYQGKILELGKRIDELNSILTIYQDPRVDAQTKSSVLSQYMLSPEDLTRFSTLMERNNLTVSDLRTIMRLTIAAGQGEDRLVTKLSSLISSTRHNDMKALIGALENYDTRVARLNPELARMARERHIADDLYGLTGLDGKPILTKLGINTNTLEYQLEFLGLAPDAKQRILNGASRLFFDGKHLVIKDPQNQFVAEFAYGATQFQVEKASFILRQIEQIMKSSNADLNLTASSQDTFPLFLDHAYSAYLRNNLTYNPETFFQTITEKDQYFHNVLSLAIRSGFSEAEAKRAIGLAASGDLRTFNAIQEKISAQFPGDTHFLFNSKSDIEDTPLQQIFGLALTNDPDKKITQTSILTGLRLFSGNLNIVRAADAHPGVNPEIVDLARMPGSLPQISMARLLNAEAPLDGELQKIFNQYPVYFMKDGQIVGQMRTSLQASREDYPDDLLSFVRNTEGPFKNDGLRYLGELFGRNFLAAIDKNRPPTGVSDPASQLIEMMGGGPPGQPLLNPSQTQHLLYHPEQYNVDYLTKLIVAVASGKMPHGMDRLTGLPSVDPTRATSVLKLGKEEIDLLCFKLESYLASRRLVAAYGENDVLTSYLNYVPLGNTKEGVPIYGFEAAAEYYFSKPVEQLTQGQKLILVGLIQQPSGYSPVQTGVVNPETITRNRALAVINLLLNEKHLITPEQAQQLRTEVQSAQFTNTIPPQWQNHIPEGGYQALSLLQRTATAAQAAPTRVPINTTYVQEGGFFVVDLTQHPPGKDATIPPLLIGILPDTTPVRQPEVSSYFSHLFNYETVDPATHISTVTLETTQSHAPINVPIPDFEQAVKNADGTWSIVHNKGFAMIAADEHGNILGGFDETNLLSNVPVPPGSTIKPFIAAFLATHGWDLRKTLVPNAPGQYALNGAVLQYPVSNPYSTGLTNGLNGVSSITLADALAISSNVPFEAAMQKYLYSHPGGVEAGWIEFQDFMGKFGLRLVDMYGRELKAPTALAAIGSDAYVPGLRNLSVGYAILSSPELWLRPDKDRTVIDAARTVTAILGDDELKRTGVAGQFMSDRGRELLSSNCGGMACFGKTGTVGGVINGREVTNYVLTAFVVDQGNGKKVVTVGIMTGQTVDLTRLNANGEPISYQDNLQATIPEYQTYGSQMVLPIARNLSTDLAHNQIAVGPNTTPLEIGQHIGGEFAATVNVPNALAETNLHIASNAAIVNSITEMVYLMRAKGLNDQAIVQKVTEYLQSRKIDVDKVIYPNGMTLHNTLWEFVAAGPNKPEIQCVAGAKLLTAITSTQSNYVDSLGWYGDAKNYMDGLFDTKVTFSNDKGVIRQIVRNITQIYPGDYFVIKNPWIESTGHMGIVTERGMTADGLLYIKIFDINYNNDGQPRSVIITQKDDMFKILGYVPPWYQPDVSAQTQVGIIRTYEAHDLIKKTHGN